MDLLQIIILALVQGITEFLPISSSAHLILAPVVLGWEDQGLAFDVAVHVGTLVAVVVYFRRDIGNMIVAWLRSFGGDLDADGRLAWYVLIGTIPVGISGLLITDSAATLLRSPLLIATTTVVFGLLLWLADRVNQSRRDIDGLRLRDAVIIGCAQALALLPGTSRSGITITAGLLLNVTPTAAARFSFLLAIPVIVLAGGVQTLELLQSGDTGRFTDLAIAAVLSAISALLAIHFFLRLIERIGMLPFVIYRLLLGAVLFWVFI